MAGGREEGRGREREGGERKGRRKRRRRILVNPCPQKTEGRAALLLIVRPSSSHVHLSLPSMRHGPFVGVAMPRGPRG